MSAHCVEDLNIDLLLLDLILLNCFLLVELRLVPHGVFHLFHAMLERVNDSLQLEFLLSLAVLVFLFKLPLDLIDFAFQLVLVVSEDWLRLDSCRVRLLLFLVVDTRDGLARDDVFKH